MTEANHKKKMQKFLKSKKKQYMAEWQKVVLYHVIQLLFVNEIQDAEAWNICEII